MNKAGLKKIAKDEIFRCLTAKDFVGFCRFVQVWNKTEQRNMTFEMVNWNQAQKDFQLNRTGRDVVLKPRQLGFSTLELVRDLFFALVNPGTVTIIVSHNQELARKLLRQVKEYYDSFVDFCEKQAGLHIFKRLDDKTSGQVTNVDEMKLANGSWIYSRHAGNNPDNAKNPGRGGRCDRLHATEIAFWLCPEETMGSLYPTLSSKAEEVYESTPNGLGNMFYLQVQDASVITNPEKKKTRNGYWLHFFPWYQDSKNTIPVDEDEPTGPTNKEEADVCRVALAQHGIELTPEQLQWWRRERIKIGSDKLCTEYPSDPASCFIGGTNTFLDGEERAFLESIVSREDGILERREVTAFGPNLGSITVYEGSQPGSRYILSADIAGGTGGDNSAFVVINVDSLELAAIYACNKLPPKDFATLVSEIGKRYNNALVSFEENWEGGIVSETLIQRGYTNLYRGNHNKRNPGGFKTHEYNKALIFDAIKTVIRDKIIKRMDRALTNELYNIAYDSDGKPYTRGKSGNAQKSEHAIRDDMVFAWGMALLIHKELPKFNSDWKDSLIIPMREFDFSRNIKGYS